MATFIPTEDKWIVESDYVALGNQYEIIDGELVERGLMSTKAVIARDNLYDLLKSHARQNNLGYVFGDGVVYYLFKETRGIKGALIPDISFIRTANLMPSWTIDDNYPGAPDLAIEVISPSNTAEEMALKVRRYLEAGTQEVWLIYPEAEELHQYLRDQMNNSHIYRIGSVLEPETFFPSLKIVIADLFKLPQLN
jgi:Uma2 family endonuclease